MSVRNRAERRKEETRERLIEVAMRLFDEQGFEFTTMEQIAARADVARKTLYNHFPVKEAIIGEYVDRSIREREPELYSLIEEHPDTRSRLTAVLNWTMVWAQARRYVFQVYLRFRLQDRLEDDHKIVRRSRLTEILQEILVRGREAREIRRDVPMPLLIAQLDTIRVLATLGWLEDPGGFPVQEFIAEGQDLLFDGCAQRTGGETGGE